MVEKYGPAFKADKNHTLVQRLGHNVLKTGETIITWKAPSLQNFSFPYHFSCHTHSIFPLISKLFHCQNHLTILLDSCLLFCQTDPTFFSSLPSSLFTLGHSNIRLQVFVRSLFHTPASPSPTSPLNCTCPLPVLLSTFVRRLSGTRERMRTEDMRRPQRQQSSRSVHSLAALYVFISSCLCACFTL